MHEPYLTPLDCLYKWEKTRPNDIYLKQPRNRIWQEYSWKDVADEARSMANALADLDVKKGDRVAIISKNCAEWIISDLAIMMNGAISVPLYPTQSDEAIQYVLEHSGAAVAFLGKLDNPEHMQKIIPVNIKKIGFNYEGIHAPLMWNDLIKHFAPVVKPYHPTLDDIYTLIYTSGTTGNPKGVVNTYSAASYAATQNLTNFSVNSQDHVLSFLPLAHVAERILVELPSLYGGFTVSFSESLETFPQDLWLVKPTRFFAVPRLWTKYRMAILENIPQKKLDILLSIPLVSGYIKKKIRKSLGLENATICASGAAPLAMPVLQWFKRLGITIQEGYGMSENWGYASFNTVGNIQLGTVGKPSPGADIKISEIGEILIKSPATMQGYYLDEEKTREVIKDGYYHTGDKGQLCKDGFLTITGRIKDTFKTSKGEFINPSHIENLLAENTGIEQLCVLGLGLPQPLALVVLSAQAKAKPQQQVTEELRHTFDKVNSVLKSHEVLNGLVVVKDEWLPENNLMTPTLKVKRNEVADRYQAIIQKYADSKTVVWESSHSL